MCMKNPYFRVCSYIHIWSNLVDHKPFDFVDIKPQVIVVPPCDQALHQSSRMQYESEQTLLETAGAGIQLRGGGCWFVE